MCKVIDSEVILRAYFKKHPKKSRITYYELKQIRKQAEPQIDDVYLDITYSSIKDLILSYPDTIEAYQEGIIIKKGFRSSKSFDKDTYQLLLSYL